MIDFIKYIPSAIKIADQESYYPEFKRKTRTTRIMDNIKWILKYGNYNYYYNMYGFDVIKDNWVNSDEYLDIRYFAITRDCLNYIGKPKYSQNAILRDKYVFYRYMKDVGMPVPEVFAVILNGNILDLNMQPIDIEIFKKRKCYFIKPIDGQLGTGVVFINDYENYILNQDRFSCGRFIIQEKIIPHSEMEKLNNNSVNTIRFVTLRDRYDKARIFSGFIRLGTSNTNNVDNCAQGGLAIGINQDGSLKKYGFYNIEYGTKTMVHPDSKIEFESFKIPNYNIARDMAINAHDKYFYGLHSIGWDIAITEDGCSFLEGNDNWDTFVPQLCDRGLKNEWLNEIKQYVSDKELKKFNTFKKHPLSWLYNDGII